MAQPVGTSQLLREAILAAERHEPSTFEQSFILVGMFKLAVLDKSVQDNCNQPTLILYLASLVFANVIQNGYLKEGLDCSLIDRMHVLEPQRIRAVYERAETIFVDLLKGQENQLRDHRVEEMNKGTYIDLRVFRVLLFLGQNRIEDALEQLSSFTEKEQDLVMLVGKGCGILTFADFCSPEERVISNEKRIEVIEGVLSRQKGTPYFGFTCEKIEHLGRYLFRPDVFQNSIGRDSLRVHSIGDVLVSDPQGQFGEVARYVVQCVRNHAPLEMPPRENIGVGFEGVFVWLKMNQ